MMRSMSIAGVGLCWALRRTEAPLARSFCTTSGLFVMASHATIYEYCNSCGNHHS